MVVLAELRDGDDSLIELPNLPFFWNDLVKTLPGSKWDSKHNVWTIKRSWPACLALRTTFKEDLEVGPRLTKWSTDEYTTRVLPCLELRDKTEADGRANLFGFQRAGAKFLSTARRALLADEMGTGKTRQSLAALLSIYEAGENPFPALIICPNSTKIGWQREAEIIWPGLKVNVITGSAVKRRKLLEEKAHIYVMNWESLRFHSRLAPFGSIALKRCLEHGGEDPKITSAKCEVEPRELNAIDFKAVIADEIHRAKDPHSKQTRAFWSASGDAEIRFALSGTPIASAIDDMWSVLHWLDEREHPSRTKYVDRYCDTVYNAYGQATVIGVKPLVEKEFFAAIDPRIRRMPKELVLKFLPPIIAERRDVEMPPKQLKAYTQMRDQMAAELEDELVVVTSPMVKMTRLLQFASSYATTETYLVDEIDSRTGQPVIDDETGLVKQKEKLRVLLHEPSCKLDAFMDDLEDFGDDSVVVFAVSRQLIELLSARLEKKKIPHGLITGAQNSDERQKHMDAFQAGKIKYILCTTAAGGTGITLTRGRTAVFLQRSWSMIENLQAEARVHRIGSEQHDSIRIVDYVTAGTVEEIVIQAVEKKSRALETILRDKDLMRRVIQGELDEADQRALDQSGSVGEDISGTPDAVDPDTEDEA